MTVKIYQVDAFTDQLFSGNPAAVCPLDHWLSTYLMQNIALENNLAETAFFVRNGDRYDIRWFTPSVEVDLCGHATLASAFVLFHVGHVAGQQVTFFSERSGELIVTKDDDLLTLDFPTDELTKVEISQQLTEGLNETPVEAYKGKTDYLLVFDSEEQIRNLKPDFAKIATLRARGVIVTARGKEVDFVSRFFAPQSGINEDPVTGSAHTTLTPYWFGRTGKTKMDAMQLSERGGRLTCTYKKDRTLISGNARLYLTGEIQLA